MQPVRYDDKSETGKEENAVFEKLTEIISNYVEVEPSDVKPESRFMEDLRFTSFDFMSMLGEIEDEFDIEIDQQEAAKIRTVQEAVDYLETLK
jgi:acyl carrier protein